MINELFDKKEVTLFDISKWVKTITFSLQYTGGKVDHRVERSILVLDALNALEAKSSIIQYTMREVYENMSQISTLREYYMGDVMEAMKVVTSIKVEYFGTTKPLEITSTILMSELLKLSSPSGVYDLKLEPLIINGCLDTPFREFLSNFHNGHGIYIPKEHLKPLDEVCSGCGMSLDGGSILENFIQQGIDGKEYYQRHPHDILVDSVEANYGEPYRFSKKLLVKVQGSREQWYECSKCNTKL